MESLRRVQSAGEDPRRLEKDGELHTTPSGIPVFQDGIDGCWYEAAPAIEGIVCAYEVHSKRAHRALPLDPLRLLVKKMRYAMPLQMSDVDAVKSALAVLRAETMNMRADYARDLVRTTQIRIELDEREAA